VVGLLEQARCALRQWFDAEGDAVYMLGATGADLGGSELLKVVHGRVAGRPPRLDLAAERRLHQLMAEATGSGLLRSAHDPSDGGLGVALAECCFEGHEPGRGAVLELPGGLRDDVLLFSESASRMVVSTRDEGVLQELARRHGVPCARLGAVGGDRLTLATSGRLLLDLPVGRLQEAWLSLERRLG
jgi:phosphoribosylformylglycinamidine synthase